MDHRGLRLTLGCTQPSIFHLCCCCCSSFVKFTIDVYKSSIPIQSSPNLLHVSFVQSCLVLSSLVQSCPILSSLRQSCQSMQFVAVLSCSIKISVLSAQPFETVFSVLFSRNPSSHRISRRKISYFF